MVKLRVTPVIFACMLLLLGSISTVRAENPTLLVLVDGFRPEMMTRSFMPNLTSVSRKGISSANHHAVYPPLPEPNALAIVTGSYSTDAQLDNSLVNLFEADGKEVHLVCSTSSAISELVKPSKTFLPPPGLLSIQERNTWAINTYLGMPSQVSLTILWLGFGDGNMILGSKQHKSLNREIDNGIQNIIKHHRKKKWSTNVFITSSGGHLTPNGKTEDLTEFLIRKGLKDSPESIDVIVRNGASIYVQKHNLKKIRNIVQELQRTEWVGAIFTQQIRLTHPEGKAKGALSFQSLYIDHTDLPDILVEPSWSDRRNEFGVPGTVTLIANTVSSTSSPLALNVPLIAFGPDIKNKVQSDSASANIDITPTLCHLAGIIPPDSMDGRILHEILIDGTDPNKVKSLRRRHISEVDLGNMKYRLLMTEYTVDGVDYVHGTKVERTTHE